MMAQQDWGGIMGPVAGVLALAVACGMPGAGAATFEEREARVWEVVEYSVTFPDWRGATGLDNPFDVQGQAVFEHAGGTRRTGMFYAGEGTWKFRFTGTRPGRWAFATESAFPALDGHTGAIHVQARADRGTRGFVVGAGSKFAVMVDDEDDLEGYVYQVYMNQQDFEQQYRHPSRIPGGADREKLIAPYWEDTQENGFDIYFFAVFYSWFRMGALSIDDFDGPEDPALDTPDLVLFDVLELAIRHAHARGGRTHLWAWGDNDRKQTPNHLGEGFRGARHQRLMRYIAARLGPLPGWSMNFGFDTVEMPNAEADCAWWAGEMNRMMGWPHVLTSRGWADPAFGAHSYAGFGGNPYDLETTHQGPVDYAEIRAHLAAHPDKPSLYEERHTYNRWQCWPHGVEDADRLNEDGCRRLIWRETMAGGMGGFFGHFSERFNAYGPFRPEGPCGYHPESLRRAFRTHRDFWREGRLLLDMAPVDGCVAGATGYALANAARTHWVFFLEQCDGATLDLSNMAGSQPAVLVDTRADYAEQRLGSLAPGLREVGMPHASDWVVAVGTWARGEP